MRKFFVGLAIAGLGMLVAGCSGPSSPYANIRFVNASADAPNVDFYVEDETAFANVPFPEYRSYILIKAGERRVAARLTGQSLSYFNRIFTLEDGRNYSMYMVNPKDFASALLVHDDWVAPAAGNGTLRIVHVASATGPVDVYITEPAASLAKIDPDFSNVPYQGTTDYREFQAGTYRIRLTTVGTKQVVYDSGDFNLLDGSVRSAIVLDGNADVPAHIDLFRDYK